MIEIQTRGQRRSRQSFTRYEKAARLADSILHLSRQLQDYCSVCERRAEAIVIHGVPADGSSFLQKPFTPALLQARIEMLLQQDDSHAWRGA